MKKIVIILLALLVACASSKPLPPSDAVYVRGYNRPDGKYVKPHYRSRPDGREDNNYGREAEYNR
jgi:hypothetical protein